MALGTLKNTAWFIMLAALLSACVHNNGNAPISEYSSSNKLPATMVVVNDGLVKGTKICSQYGSCSTTYENFHTLLLDEMKNSNVFAEVYLGGGFQKPKEDTLLVNIKREIDKSGLNDVSAFVSATTLFIAPVRTKVTEKYNVDIIKNGTTINSFNFEVDNVAVGSLLLLSTWKDSDTHIAKSVATKIISEMQKMNVAAL